MPRIPRRAFRKERGQALVEMALVMPVLLLVLLGILEFGRFYGTHLALQHGAREGARLAVVGAGDAEIEARALEVTQSLNPEDLEIAVEPPEFERETGDAITVKLRCRFRFVAPLVASIVGENLNMAVSTTMRME